MNHLSALIAQEETASGSAAFQFVLLAAVPLALYFLMIRPQRRKMREAAEMQASLAVGDEVITGSGIYGFITAVEDDLFWIEVDEDVQLRVVKSQVTAASVVRRHRQQTTIRMSRTNREFAPTPMESFCLRHRSCDPARSQLRNR